MPSRKLPAEALDADNPRAGVLSAAAHSSVTEADELAQVEARAEVARARAISLRQQAEAASEETQVERDAGVASDEGETQSAPTARRWLHRPRRKALITPAGLVII